MHLIVLAGGRNSRIGTKKALLPVGGVPIVQRTIDRLASAVEGSLIVTADPEAFAFTGVPTTADRYPGRGPLGGLHAGLTVSPDEFNLVVACDMPFVSAALASYLREECARHSETDAAIPRWRRGREPLFAVYRRRAAEALVARLEAGDYCLRRLDEAVRVREVEVTEWAGQGGVELEQAFFNVNTWADLERAEAFRRTRAASAIAAPVAAAAGGDMARGDALALGSGWHPWVHNGEETVD